MLPGPIATAETLIWAALLHSVWLGLAAASIAALCGSLVPPSSHRVRRAIALAGLGMVAIGSPGVALVQRIAPRAAPPLEAHHGVVLHASAVRASGPPSAASASAPRSIAQASPIAEFGWFRAIQETAKGLQVVRPYLMVLWAFGAGVSLAALVVGTLRLRRVRGDGVLAEHLDTQVRALARRLRLRRIPDVRVHPGVPEPCLAGFIQPLILLPERWLARATDDVVMAVLAHEAAHARRLDHAANVAQRLSEICLFFHPCVHWLSRLARREAEYAADALAVRVTRDPLALARALESVACFRSSASRPPAFGVAVGGDRPALLPRIQELLGMKPPRPRLALWPFAALPAAVAAAIVSIPVAAAQDAPSGDQPRLIKPAEAPTSNAPPNVLPAGMSQEERLRLVNTDPRKLSPEEREKLNTLDQISYQVRFLEVTDAGWKRLEEALSKPRDAAKPAGGWLVKTADLETALRRMPQAYAAREIMAPKVTAYEGASVHLHFGNVAPDDQDGSGLTMVTGGLELSLSRKELSRLAKESRENGNTLLLDGLKAGFDLRISGLREPDKRGLDARVSMQTTSTSPPLSPTSGESKRPPQSRLTVARKAEEFVPDESSLLVDTGVSIKPGPDAEPPGLLEVVGAMLGPGPEGGRDAQSLRTIVVITPQHLSQEVLQAAWAAEEARRAEAK